MYAVTCCEDIYFMCCNQKRALTFARLFLIEARAGEKKTFMRAFVMVHSKSGAIGERTRATIHFAHCLTLRRLVTRNFVACSFRVVVEFLFIKNKHKFASAYTLITFFFFFF